MVDQVKQITTRFRKIDYGAQVKKAWGIEYGQADTGYIMSNGRKFDNTDRAETGVYRRP